MDEPKWHYFTFGVWQRHEGHYTKFFGTYMSARHQMIKRHGLEWAFQYSEEEWKRWEEECRRDGMEWMLETELK